jgi:predicted 3-demethylubiquinone-9 3-methyltransferase (glyoxalase superfamily)
MNKISTSFIINGRAQEAAEFYTSLIKDSQVIDVAHAGDGTVAVVTFELAGQHFLALNSGPDDEFTMSASVYVNCDSQDEVDELWEKLTEGGEESICGWLVDRYGLSWQIIPSVLPTMLTDPDPQKASRVMSAMMGMNKINVAALEKAYAGG